ncbi:EAL domain-containing protein [Thalassotalea piscium]|uniref:cyclic-guanylate-specific phosphodiesterase n=1 Tax=Thalassotalea piscium TaxID=1230533 RepID=A0A7X0TTI7_9GAMM|nr:EAL domain-containing protein [Thalassotalea piscium]MBB6543193.1 sensor c-di-GMP phosphodiesterase-like protein [Thalassotalea piscium]
MLNKAVIRKPLSFITGMMISLIVIFFLYSQFLSNQLSEEAKRIFSDLSHSANSGYKVIEKLNNLPFTDCTDEHLLSMREMQFNSNDIRDIGFLQNGFLICTTGAGVLDIPLKESTPDFTLDGHDYWIDKKLETFDNKVKGIIIEKGSYNIVLSFEGVINDYEEAVVYEIVLKDDYELTHLYGAPNLYKNVAVDPNVITFAGFIAHFAELCGPGGGICLAVKKNNFTELQNPPVLFVVMLLLFLSGISAIHFIELLFYHLRSTKRRIKLGLAAGSFIPYYQPIVELNSGKVIGCELLARFEDGVGALYPDEFISVVSELNLSWMMTELFIHKALDDFKHLKPADSTFYLSVNIFPKDINNGNILKGIELFRAAQPNLRVCFEITEDEQLQCGQSGEALDQLSKSRIQISIDDFGTGYSNLSQLKLLDIDTIKIDKSFVDEVETGAIRSTLIPNIVAIANKLNANVIAEGVENQLQADELLKMNIVYGQGWHYAKALPIDEFKQYLIQNSDFTFNNDESL